MTDTDTTDVPDLPNIRELRADALRFLYFRLIDECEEPESAYMIDAISNAIMNVSSDQCRVAANTA